MIDVDSKRKNDATGALMNLRSNFDVEVSAATQQRGDIWSAWKRLVKCMAEEKYSASELKRMVISHATDQTGNLSLPNAEHTVESLVVKTLIQNTCVILDIRKMVSDFQKPTKYTKFGNFIEYQSWREEEQIILKTNLRNRIQACEFTKELDVNEMVKHAIAEANRELEAVINKDEDNDHVEGSNEELLREFAKHYQPNRSDNHKWEHIDPETVERIKTNVGGHDLTQTAVYDKSSRFTVLPLLFRAGGFLYLNSCYKGVLERAINRLQKND